MAEPYRTTVYYTSQIGKKPVLWDFIVDEVEITASGGLVVKLAGQVLGSWAAGQWHSTYTYQHVENQREWPADA